MRKLRYLAAVGVAGIAAAIATPAQALAEYCEKPTWNVVNEFYGEGPRTLVIGLENTTRLLEVRTADESGADCTADSFAIASNRVFRAEGEFGAEGALGARSGQATAAVLVPPNDDYAGSRNVSGTLRDTAGSTSYDYFGDLQNVIVKRRTTLGQTQATPEPAALNQDVHVSGRLLAASWTADRYVGAGYKVVTLQKRTAGGVYEKVITGRTDGSGWARFVVNKGAGTECFRLVYGGTTYLAAAAGRGDCVAQA